MLKWRGCCRPQLTPCQWGPGETLTGSPFGRMRIGRMLAFTNFLATTLSQAIRPSQTLPTHVSHANSTCTLMQASQLSRFHFTNTHARTLMHMLCTRACTHTHTHTHNVSKHAHTARAHMLMLNVRARTHSCVHPSGFLIHTPMTAQSAGPAWAGETFLLDSSVPGRLTLN